MHMPFSFKYKPIDTIRNQCIRILVVLLFLLVTCIHCMAESGIEDLFTDTFSVPGWKVDGEAYRYSPQSLYEYINGGAYFFIGYGFVELTGANVSPVTGENDAVAVDIYDMGDKLNAFGVYQLRKDSQAPSLGIGTASFGSNDYLVFHKDRFYVEIRAFFSDRKDQGVLENMASIVAEHLPGDNSLPKELAYFPEKEKIIGSERYISGGILGHAFFDKGLSCDYHIKGKKVTAFIVFLPSVRDAVRSVKRHKTFLKQSEKKYLPLEEFGKHSFISEEPYHQKIIVIQEGARVIGAYDLNDVEAGKTLLADILRKIKQTTAKQK